VVRSVNERRGVRERGDQSKEISGFNGFINRNLLMELPVVGKKCMWLLVSEEWLQKWSMSKQYVQPREVSDHCAIVVKSLVKDWNPKSIRTIDLWLMERGFKDLVKDKWMSYAVHGNGISKLKDKLKMLKSDLKVGNYEVFGHLNSNKERILKEIEDLDCQDANGVLEENARSKRMELIGMLAVMNKKIDSLISQKARANWYKGFSILCLDGEDLEIRLKVLWSGTNGARNQSLFGERRKICLNKDLRQQKTLGFDLLRWSLNLSLWRII